MQKTIIIFGILWNYAHCILIGFENGQYYKVTSVATGKFLTVDGQQFKSGANVVVQEWNGHDNQKWLTLEAQPMTSFARSALPSNHRFYLISTRQEKDWGIISQNGTVNITLNNLMELTEVLTLNGITGNLTTEVFSKGSSSQQWIPEDAGDGRIFIRNLGNNQCVKNFDYRQVSLFQKLASFLSRLRQPNKHVSKPLGTFDCNPREIAEKWIVEVA